MRSSCGVHPSVHNDMHITQKVNLFPIGAAARSKRHVVDRHVKRLSRGRTGRTCEDSGARARRHDKKRSGLQQLHRTALLTSQGSAKIATTCNASQIAATVRSRETTL